jgi:AICAR transformylase/IMP cyclohydrolase PurH
MKKQQKKTKQLKGSALSIKNILIEDSSKRIVKQQHGPRPYCC